MSMEKIPPPTKEQMARLIEQATRAVASWPTWKVADGVVQDARERVKEMDIERTTQEKIEALGDLYEKTGVDWHLEVNLCLTEPVCPMATISPEGEHWVRFRADKDTIMEAIDASVDMAYNALILGDESTLVQFPATNKGETIEALKERIAKADKEYYAALGKGYEDMFMQEPTENE